MQQDRMYVNVTSAEFQEILDFPMENTNECQTFVSGWLAELQAKNVGTFDLLRAADQAMYTDKGHVSAERSL